MVLQTYSAGCSFTPPMVEARGVEPLSENPLIQLSTSVFRYLEFPLADVNGQTSALGSLLVRDRYKSKLSVHVHRSNDAQLEAAILSEGTGGYIKPRHCR